MVIISEIKNRQNRGFTIIELLIVIVVIAILATIVVIAFNGVQQRARNTARIASAEKVEKLFAAYSAINGVDTLKSTLQPPAGGNYAEVYCVGSGYEDIDSTAAVGCYGSSSASAGSSATLDSLLSSMGGNLDTGYPKIDMLGLLSSAPAITFYGPDTLTRINGSKPFISMIYFLEGTNADCRLANVIVKQSANTGTTPAGATNSGAGPNNSTTCIINLDAYLST